MKSLAKRSTTPYGIIIAACFMLVLFFGLFINSRVEAQSAANQAGERLITIHDDGEDKGILTKDTTLRQAFKDAGIYIDPNDLVEPGLDEELASNNYEVNIYRARPVTIVDGTVRQKVMSPYQTPKQIAKQAGITLHDEDTATLSSNTDMVSEGAGLQMDIKRATPFTLVLYGKEAVVYTQAKTVGDMMKQKGIKMAANDTLSVAQSAPIAANMRVELWRNGKQTLTQDQDIPFETEQVKDADQPVGYKQIQTPGVLGKKSVSYEIDMQNGKEVSRTEIQSVVIAQPQKQIEVIGTKVSLPPGSHTDWMAAAGIASSDFDYASFIFQHESGWRPDAVSSNGYYGLGQTSYKNITGACPSWQTDPICQIRFFNGYVYSHGYGSWQNAVEHWQTYKSW